MRGELERKWRLDALSPLRMTRSCIYARDCSRLTVTRNVGSQKRLQRMRGCAEENEQLRSGIIDPCR